MKYRFLSFLLIFSALFLFSCNAENDEPFFSMTDTETAELPTPSEKSTVETSEPDASESAEADSETVLPNEEKTEVPTEEKTEVTIEEKTTEGEEATLPQESSEALNDTSSKEPEPPEEEPIPITPEKLLEDIETRNGIAELLAKESNVLIFCADAESGNAERMMYYALEDGMPIMEEQVFGKDGELASSFTVRDGACYTMNGEKLSLCILPDTHTDYIFDSFGFSLFPDRMEAVGFYEENGLYYMTAHVSLVNGNTNEYLEYVYAVDTETLHLQSAAIYSVVSNRVVRHQSIAIDMSDSSYEAEMLAYRAHLNAEDAITLRVQVRPQGRQEERTYTVSASAEIGAYVAYDGTPFAVYKNEKCTKNVTDLSFANGSEIFVYVEEWIGEVSWEFKLTEDDLERFRASVAEFEAIAIAGRDAEGMIEAYLALSEIFEWIDSQATVAYVLYYSDISDPDSRENYLLAQSVSSDANAIMRAAYTKIYESGSPLATLLFAGWSDEELALLGADNAAVSELEQANASLLLEYHGLNQGSASWGDDVNRIYESFVSNNHRISAHYGFENYYEYLSKIGYNRDYGAEEREAFRAYVKEYVVPLYAEGMTRFYEAYAALNMTQTEWLSALVLDSYDAHSVIKRYIDAYINSFTPSLAQKMSAMFEKDVMVFGTAENAYEGAFTTFLSLYEEPIAYFGPGCTDLLTVLHENGHYAAYYSLSSSQIPSLDLCEVHSQGNEWLFVSYLKSSLDPAVYEVFMLNRLLYGLNVIIYATVVDECEELIYSAQTPYTAEEYDGLIDSVISSYGTFVVESFPDLRNYFKLVALESPVYYLSYATSEMASMALYLMGDEDFDGAIEAYTMLVEDASTDDKLLCAIERAGLPSPFKEETFQMLNEVFGAYFNGGEKIVLPAA